MPLAVKPPACASSVSPSWPCSDDALICDTATWPPVTWPDELMLRPVTLKPSIDTLQPHYREIAVPTVVIHGDADRTVSIAIHARAFVKEVEAARLIELKGVGHMVQNVAPEIVMEAIASVMPQARLMSGVVNSR